MLIPDLFYLFYFIIAGAFLFANLSSFLSLTQSDLSIIKENFSSIAISLAIFILLTFLIGSLFLTMKLTLIKDILKNKKIKFQNIASNLKLNYLNLISLRIIVFLIFIIVLILFILLSKIFEKFIFIAGILFFIVLITLVLGFLFRYPFLILENKKPVQSLKLSFNFFKKQKSYTLLTLIILFAAAFFFGFISSLLSAIKINLIQYFFKIALMLIISVWSNIFIFLSFTSKLKSK